MSSSDVRMLEELTARVAALEEAQQRLAVAIERTAEGSIKLGEAVAHLLPKDVAGELYGAEPDHAADREARAALVRRPPRPA